MAVLWQHAAVFSITDPKTSSYLAVDFFFLLSGFVVSYAYDRKLDQGMSWREFAKVRLIRLYPMLFAGTVLGGSLMVLKAVLNHGYAIAEAPWLALPGLLLIPAGLAVGTQAYPANNPVWSLFFELVANGVYASPLRRAPWIGIPVFSVTAGILIASAASSGSFEPIGFENWLTFTEGFARVAAPFLLGIFIYRSRVFERLPRLPFWAVAGLLCAALAIHVKSAWVYDCFAALIVFPIIVALGANVKTSRLGEKVCDLLGALSYPLYLLHRPIFRLVELAATASHRNVAPLLVWMAAVLVSIGGAWIALKVFDQPIRTWLTSKLVARAPQSGSHTILLKKELQPDVPPG